MPKILLAVDGSEGCERAVDALLKQIRWYREPPEVFVLNVQPALPQSVTMFAEGFEVEEYHQSEGRKALAAVMHKLDTARVHYAFRVSVGDPANLIASYAREQRCDQIILGAHGLSRTPGIVVGSIAIKVVHLADVPVLLVK